VRAPSRPVPAAKEEAAPSRVAAALNMLRGKSPPLAPEYQEAAFQEPAYHISAIDDVADSLRHDGGLGGPIAVFGAARGVDSSWTALKIARALAETSRVILVGLGSADAAIRTTSIDPSASGLADLADGAASFGSIITKDRQSGVHLISSGHVPTDRNEILVSDIVPASFEALSRSYDFVVVAAGATGGPELEDIAAIAPAAVLVAGTLTNAGTASARERLLNAGFEDVIVVVGTTADVRAAAEAA
jgi:succinoglycan biosynthesis transport protein ExoP